jgi:hypothetical protein
LVSGSSRAALERRYIFDSFIGNEYAQHLQVNL